jgi:pyruvate formate lyase activating enzyme
VRCQLCPHSCSIAPAKRGICGVRENREGTLYSMNYGRVSSINIDPIEKKPLFHFYPGSAALSLGSIGCTFRCAHCQNFTISMAALSELNTREIAPEDVPRLALDNGCQGVAFTYNEPTIWHEFAYDACKLIKEQGLYTVYVTNGFIQEAPLRELAPYLDAMNIDVKGFTEHFYKDVCKAPLQPVLDTVRLALSLGIHVELTYLIIPGRNDAEEELRGFARWCADGDPRVPVHFSRFHPDYQLTDAPPTPVSTMELAKRVATEEGLKFVYLGNVRIPHGEDTYCPKCGTLVVQRTGFGVSKLDARDGRCPVCGEDLYMVQPKEKVERSERARLG